MSKSNNVFLRPENDDFSFSSLVSHHFGAWRSGLTILGAALLLAGCQAETAPAPNADRLVQIQRVTFETAGASASSSARCARATKPISGSGSAARSSRA
jgi:hypothetical protein